MALSGAEFFATMVAALADDPLLTWLEEVAEKHGFSGAADADGDAGDGDGRSDLEREYEKLGGDAALLKALRAEDDLFRKELDKQRALAQRWQKDRRFELANEKEELAGTIGDKEKGPATWKAWLEREKAALEPIEARARELGEKLSTEAGKELSLAIGKHRERIEGVERFLERDRRDLEIARPHLELVELRLKDVDRTYEAIEQRIRDARTELDNVLELEAMTLEEKVKHLRAGSTKTLPEAQKRLEDELRKIKQDSAAADRQKVTLFQEPRRDFHPEPLDWKPIEKKLAELAKASLDELRKKDPTLARLEKKYEAAGGDEALFDKRLAEWKERAKGVENVRGNFAYIQREQEAELQKRLEETQLSLRQTEQELTALRSKQSQAKARIQELTSRGASGDLLSKQEAAQLELLRRALKRLEKDIPDREKLLPIHRRSREDIEGIIEKTRQAYELSADDDTYWQIPPEPRSKDLLDLPLRAKYEELTSRR